MKVFLIMRQAKNIQNTLNGLQFVCAICLCLAISFPAYSAEDKNGKEMFEDIRTAVAEVLSSKETPEEDGVIIQLADYVVEQIKNSKIVLDDAGRQQLSKTISSKLIRTPSISRYPAGDEGRELAVKLSQLEIKKMISMWEVVKRPDNSEYNDLIKETEILNVRLKGLLDGVVADEYFNRPLVDAMGKYSMMRNRSINDGASPFFKSTLSAEQQEKWLQGISDNIEKSQPAIRKKLEKTPPALREAVVLNWLLRQIISATSVEKGIRLSFEKFSESQLNIYKQFSGETQSLQLKLAERSQVQLRREVAAMHEDLDRQVELDNLEMKRLQKEAIKKNELKRQQFLQGMAKERKRTKKKIEQ